ncbi:MAG: sugar phosphate isomerase/epimerase family protein [Microscillaceae bacterium]|nr:sugar phosphate isomerase/epimerase family protein [Microscillaceae bacterium]
MNRSRRHFLQKSSLLLAGTLALPQLLKATPKTKQLVGVQLYSIREDMKKDPLATLKQLAEFGYKYVEHANYVDRKFYGYSATEFKKVLADLGMKMPSGHTVMNDKHWDESKKDFTDLWKYTVEDAAIVGQEFVISPWMDAKVRSDKASLDRLLEVFNKSGELCKKSGMRFGYHNHDFEFSEMIEGGTLYDYILKNTDPNLVIQQLDTGNLYNGGAKAMDVVKKYPGRFVSLHVKDEILSEGSNEKYESTILGKGIVNLKEVVDAAKQIGGSKHFIIEQEAYQGKTPLESVKEDLEVMKKWGY